MTKHPVLRIIQGGKEAKKRILKMFIDCLNGADETRELYDSLLPSFKDDIFEKRKISRDKYIKRLTSTITKKTNNYIDKL